MNTEDSEFARLEHEALLRASQPEQPEQEPLEYWNAVEGWVKIDEVREHFDSVGCGTIYKSTGEGRTPLYTTPPHHTLQERLAELHLYEEINEHYAKCNAGAENLRDWVAERMDAELVQPVEPEVLNEAQTDAGVMALLQCSESDLESFSPKMCERYAADVARVYRAMIAQPAEPPQRPWVGLTEKERLAIMRRPSGTERGLAVLIEAKLKEKNE